MRTRRHNAEQVVRKLRTAEVELARGAPVKELERENAPLKKLLADAELDKAILKGIAEGNF